MVIGLCRWCSIFDIFQFPHRRPQSRRENECSCAAVACYVDRQQPTVELQITQPTPPLYFPSITSQGASLPHKSNLDKFKSDPTQQQHCNHFISILFLFFSFQDTQNGRKSSPNIFNPDRAGSCRVFFLSNKKM